jgi:putative transposase
MQWRGEISASLQPLLSEARGASQDQKKKIGRQVVWITQELFTFVPRVDEAAGTVQCYQLDVGTHKCPVGFIPYVAHRPHAVPSSIHITVEGDHWWLSFAADDPTVTLLGKDVDVATERIAEDLRHLSADPLAERALGGDRGVAQPLVTSDGQTFDLQPVQKERIEKARRQRTK